MREIREVTLLQKRYDTEVKARKEAESNEEQDNEGEKLPDITIPHTQRAMFVPENGTGPLEGRDYYDNDEADDKDAGGRCLLYTCLLLDLRYRSVDSGARCIDRLRCYC